MPNLPIGSSSFSEDERAVLLAIKGVGPAVVSRFEELGITSLADLAQQEPADICRRVAILLGSTCWSNSPIAKASVSRAVETARTSLSP